MDTRRIRENVLDPSQKRKLSDPLVDLTVPVPPEPQCLFTSRVGLTLHSQAIPQLGPLIPDGDPELCLATSEQPDAAHHSCVEEFQISGQL